MEDSETVNLDKEFKRYLQLLRPYLGQLVDRHIIETCDAWIQRLSQCNDDEKATRNEYIFLLCYQLAKGVLGTPFLNNPPMKLQILSDDINSDDESSEVEYIVVNSNSKESKTKVIFNPKKILSSETEYNSKEDSRIVNVSVDSVESIEITKHETQDKKTITCNQNLQITRNNNKTANEEYELRANSLVKKLREIKIQNTLLQKELVAIKEEGKFTRDDLNENCVTVVDNTPHPHVCSSNSSLTLKSIRCQVQEIKDSKKVLTETICNLQNQLAMFNDLKTSQIEDIKVKHKLELIKVQIDARKEMKIFYENKIEDLKLTNEETISKVQKETNNDIKHITELKDKIIFDKNVIIEAKNKEICALKNEIEVQKGNIQAILNKIIEKSSEDASNESLKIKNQLLQKRLNKVEKTKLKCAKGFEAKLVQLQREKHLSECSLQLQLVRQRAQIVGELMDEHQTELTNSLEKLEVKYKDIVANVQATAIQRRIQDQKALESILQAVCDVDDEDANQSNTFSNQARNHSQSYDSDSGSVSHARNNRIRNVTLANKYYNENTVPSFCLSGDRMGELFNRVYIPQKDNPNIETK